jgi:hypothetical protein
MTDRHDDVLAWWQLHRCAADWQRALGAGLLGWLGTALVMVLAGVLSWAPGSLPNWMAVALLSAVGGVILGQAAGRAVGRYQVVPTFRQMFRIWPGSPLSRVPRPVRTGLPALVLALWLAWSVKSVVAYLQWEQHPRGPEPSMFLPAFLILAVFAATDAWFDQLAPGVPQRNESVDPARALALGRRRAVRPALAIGLGAATSLALVLLSAHFDEDGPTGPTAPARRWLTLALISLTLGAMAGCYRLVRSLWYAYLHARLQLALTARLPLRLSAFLADAHRLGILRQVGPVYQFRHARLRERLAEVDRVSP